MDGLNADLLYRAMRQTNPATGKSPLPWFSHIFAENGTIFENFYTHGISLSTPSWSILDSGHHAIIRGNVEYDRYTGHVYDYLNMFPFYLGYARKREVDMPGVQVLDRAGIPLVIDAFGYPHVFQSFQLFQRGVRWRTLEHALARRFSSRMILSMLESVGTPPLDESLAAQTEQELDRALKNPRILYADFFTGDVDHTAHATNEPAALMDALRHLDALAGRIWTAIQSSPLARQTIFAAVSDHGMNNVPGVFSQSFNLADLFNSPEGGAHHVVTNRHELGDFKLRGLNPLVQRVINPSTASFYLSGQSDQYPTAWLDLDGNERAAVNLRNSDVNKIHILLLQSERRDLPQNIRRAAALCLRETIHWHRDAWTRTAAELTEEMQALQQAIEQRRHVVAQYPKNWTPQQRAAGDDKAALRAADELESWEHEHSEYTSYISHLQALLAFTPDPEGPLARKISDLIPELSLGDNNSVHDLEHYIAGPAAGGLVLNASGELDEERSFRHVNYFQLLTKQRARNNPQPALSARPIDFIAMRVPDGYWLYTDDDHQLLILADDRGRLALQPVRDLSQDAAGKLTSSRQPWCPGLPLHLFEDPHLRLPSGAGRASWLSAWHTEREWLEAIHMTKYSNGVIGITEELSPIAGEIPGPPGISPVLLRYERRRRELVQADFHIFAADHWNFNVRNFNPGGNHGGFFRISTHSVWMMAGAGIPAGKDVIEPYDSLNFASTILNMSGHPPPMPDRVVALH